MASSVLGRLSVLLGLDAAEFDKGVNNAKRSLNDLKSSFGVVQLAGTAAFGALAHSALAYADQIVDTAKANDVAVESVLKLGNALANNGGKAEDAGKFLAKFSSFVDSAASGSDEAQETFKKLGVSLKELGSLSTENLFQKTLEGLANIEDPITRNAKAFEVFGKAAKGVDFTTLLQGLRDGNPLAKEQAAGLLAAAQANDDFAESWRNLQVAFTTVFGPMIKDLAELTKQWSADGKLNTGIKAFGYTLIAITAASTIAGIVRLVQALSTVVTVMRTVGVAAAFASAGVSAVLGAAGAAAVVAGIAAVDALGGGNQPTPSSDTNNPTLNLGRTVAPPKAATAKAEALKKQRDADLLKSQEYAAEEFFKTNKANRKAQEELDKQLELQRQHFNDATNNLEQYLSKLDDRNRKEAELTTIIREQGITARDYGESIFGNLEAAIDSFATTGKLRFSDLARSIISDLAKMQAKAVTTSFFNSLFGIGGKFGPSLGGGGNVGTLAGGAVLGGPFGGAADGGNISGPTIVGERGPELFIPNGAGKVIPNSLTSGLLGGQQVSNTFNINTIDAKGVSEFLYSNAKTILGATQYAQSSLVTSRGRA